MTRLSRIFFNQQILRRFLPPNMVIQRTSQYRCSYRYRKVPIVPIIKTIVRNEGQRQVQIGVLALAVSSVLIQDRSIAKEEEGPSSGEGAEILPPSYWCGGTNDVNIQETKMKFGSAYDYVQAEPGQKVHRFLVYQAKLLAWREHQPVYMLHQYFLPTHKIGILTRGRETR
ncbi:hypothetical protein EDD18DRAFT_1336950 [Armillaria luteobubalina]|uniref:Uncharacterized protein n=1 Tax=Armillaria luteobubalina TaxID=153913 RepID=A0AA39UC20_9AGAR|nr:hypothetical protein EDD18DRAFT_1336950 [Armillaria luteobubalina]